MIKPKITITGVDNILNDVDDLVKHRIPKMAVLASTEIAKKLREYLKSKIVLVFNAPTPFTQKSLYYKSANIQSPEAYVWFKDYTSISKSNTKESLSGGGYAADYLYPQVHGGSRDLKNHEKDFIRIGVMRSGYYAVPGEGVKLDKYGNIPRATILKIMSRVKALKEVGYTANESATTRKRRSKKDKGMFVSRVGDKNTSHLAPGIYERTATGGVRPLIMFVKKPSYQQRYAFYEWSDEFVNANYKEVYNRIASETLEYHRSKG